MSRSASNRGAPAASIRFPPSNFKHFLTLFSKSFSSFPRGTCSLSVSCLYLALEGIYLPLRAAFPNSPTRRQRLVEQQGPNSTGFSPSPTSRSRELGPGPLQRTLLQTTIRGAKPLDFQSGLFPDRRSDAFGCFPARRGREACSVPWVRCCSRDDDGCARLLTPGQGRVGSPDRSLRLRSGGALWISADRPPP